MKSNRTSDNRDAGLSPSRSILSVLAQFCSGALRRCLVRGRSRLPATSTWAWTSPKYPRFPDAGSSRPWYSACELLWTIGGDDETDARRLAVQLDVGGSGRRETETLARERPTLEQALAGAR